MKMRDLTGQRFGKLTALSRAENRVTSSGSQVVMWNCLCDCGNTTVVSRANLTSGHTLSCGCSGRKYNDIVGTKYGRLTIIEELPQKIVGGHSYRMVKCQCECGNIVTILFKSILSGATKSCGCYAKEQAAEVGRSKKKYNEYDLESESFGIGYTTKGEKFYFDKDDYELIKDHCWYITGSRGGYVVSTDNRTTIMLHRLILGVTDPKMDVDHINHNPNDNRKENLRVVTRSQNNANMGLRVHNTSGCTGVTWHSTRKQWISRISIDKKDIFLGWFNDYDEAVKARKEAEEKYFGEYSYDNSINKNKEESA